MRRHQVFDRSVETLDEGGGHAVRSRRHVNRLRLDLNPVGILPVHPAIDVDERAPLPVHGEFDLLVKGRRLAEEVPGRLVLEGEPENVVPVRGEVVHDGDPAARADRSARHVLPLLGVARHLVFRLARRHGRVPEREPADLARGGQVSVEQRRGEVLDVRDVVEARADRLVRQVGGGVDVEPEERPDRALVLRPIQPLEGTDAGVGAVGRRGIDPRFERLGQLEQVLGRGTPDPRRRHHPGPQLADHLLRRLRLEVRHLHLEPLQREVPQHSGVVVAVRADLVHDRLRDRVRDESVGLRGERGGEGRTAWKRGNQPPKRNAGQRNRESLHESLVLRDGRCDPASRTFSCLTLQYMDADSIPPYADPARPPVSRPPVSRWHSLYVPIVSSGSTKMKRNAQLRAP